MGCTFILIPFDYIVDILPQFYEHDRHLTIYLLMVGAPNHALTRISVTLIFVMFCSKMTQTINMYFN